MIDEEYADLRAETPNKEIRDYVNKNIKDLIGTKDEALRLIIKKIYKQIILFQWIV